MAAMPAASDLRGASADSLAALREQLGEGGGDAASVGEQLLAAASLIRSEPSLRRALTDPSVPGESKSDLVRSLVGDQLDDAALDVVASAATKRWTRSTHLAAALEELGVEALVRSSDDAGVVADELFAVLRTVQQSSSLRDALSDPARSQADKQELVRSLLQDKVVPATRRLVEQALSGTHRTVDLALEHYQRVAAAAHGERVARVTVATELSEEETERLSDALGRHYDRDIHLNVVVDPAVLGGVKVEIGDDVIDGTIAARLAEADRLVAR